MSTRKLTEIGVRSSVKLTGDIGKDLAAINKHWGNAKTKQEREATTSVHRTELERAMNTQNNGECEG